MNIKTSALRREHCSPGSSRAGEYLGWLEFYSTFIIAKVVFNEYGEIIKWFGLTHRRFLQVCIRKLSVPLSWVKTIPPYRFRLFLT